MYITNAMSKDLLELMPYYLVSALPSRFIGYPEGTKIYYRLLTTRESLEIAKMQKLYDIYRYILKGVKTEGIEKEDLFMADLIFISILRSSQSGMVNALHVEATCTKCGERIKKEVGVEDVYMEDYDKVQKRYEIEGTDVVVVFERPRVRRYLEYLEYLDEENADQDMASLALPIKAIENFPEKGMYKELSLREAMEIAEDLPVAVFEELSEGLREEPPKVVVVCDSCGEENKYPIDNYEEVVIKPFRRP